LCNKANKYKNKRKVTLLNFQKTILLLAVSFLLSIMLISSKDDTRSYHHVVYATANTNTNGTKSFNVMILKGSANPQIDITKLGPRQWYLPREITVRVNDTVTWTNNDTESHTVTSGIGAGIESLMNNKKGTPNGLFDSGSFKPGQSWTHTFTRPGTYTYFCTIHPWMDGVVTVQGKAQNIPNYPVYASGVKINTLPWYIFTPDGKFEVGLSWDPTVLLTGKDISFIVTFFDRANNRPNLLPYDFVIIQGGKQLERIPSTTQYGTNVQHYVFSNSGPINIRIENVGAVKSSDVQFNTKVFDNPNISSAAAAQLAAAANKQSSNPFAVSYLTLVYIEYAVIFGIPAGVAAMVVWARRYKRK
jgi:plastocyanin